MILRDDVLLAEMKCIWYSSFSYSWPILAKIGME